MPSFWRKDARYFVSYITGPSHVLLGLSFGSASAEPSLVRLPPAGSCDHGKLDETRILEAVLSGVSETGASLHPREIVFCEGDSPRYELYQHCARVLTLRVASGESFPEEGAEENSSGAFS